MVRFASNFLQIVVVALVWTIAHGSTFTATTTTTAMMMTLMISVPKRAHVSAWKTPMVVQSKSHYRSTLVAVASSKALVSSVPTRPTTSSTLTRHRFDDSTFHSRSLIPTTRLFSTTGSVTEDSSLFVNDATFQSIGIQNPVLLERLAQLGMNRPTKVQAQVFPKLLRPVIMENENSHLPSKQTTNVIIGSETGSGKTLAYLLPLLDDILQQKEQQKTKEQKALSYDYARAIILVPNKELVQQVLRMAVPLCGGSSCVVWSGGVQLSSAKSSSSSSSSCPQHQLVRLAVLPGGLSEPLDFKPFRDTIALGGGTEPPVDLIISTPAALGPLGLKPKYIDMFADIQTLVIDEADMLLDGGYIRPLEHVLMGFRRADRLDPSMGVLPTQHVFCAATLPDMGLKSVDSYLQRKFPYAERVQMSGMHNARHYGLKEETQWIGPIQSKKERMERLIEMLETPVQDGGLLGEKVMIFLNSVDDVDGAQVALQKAGITSVPYHAKLGLEERTKFLDQYRNYDSQKGTDTKDNSVPVLVCTDLASRGLDVPGVNAVVQLQFSGNVVSHLHRMGRCGRAGQRTGRGIVFYNEAEAELVQVVQQAEEQQERMILEGDVDDRLNEDDAEEAGKVNNAFSRKRGFTKKRKKLQREAQS